MVDGESSGISIWRETPTSQMALDKPFNHSEPSFLICEMGLIILSLWASKNCFEFKWNNEKAPCNMESHYRCCTPCLYAASQP